MNAAKRQANLTDMASEPLAAYYRYTALPEGSIRLFKILPTCVPRPDGSSDDLLPTPKSGLEKQVEISLEVFPFSSCPAYTALSYTWGPSGSLSDQPDDIFTRVASCFPIICSRRIILGTRNLRDAMRYIRHGIDRIFFSQDLTDERRAELRYYFQDVTYMWIDAICIDQSNLIERNHQVRLMSQIYRRAHRTFIWLGKADNSSHEGTAVMSKILENVISAQKESERRVGQEVRVQPLNLSLTEKTACATLLSRKWFSRYWILQEALLSREAIVLIGTRMTSFLAYERIRTLNQIAGFSFSDVKPAPERGDVLLQNDARNTIATLTYMERCRDEIREGNLPSFMSVMNMCRAQECFDPRDRIYSTLGLCREFSVGGQLSIQPDYTRSVEDIFLEATMSVIATRKDLAVLNLVWHDTDAHDLPSWCPDYRNLQSTLIRVPLDDARPWRLRNRPAHAFTVTREHLMVYGQQIGVIQEIAGLMEFQSSERLQDGLAYSGLRGALSLLTRLQMDDEVTIGRMQSLGRIDLFWHTIMSNMFACFEQLADWTETPLPEGAGLLLPQLIRSLMCHEHIVSKIRFENEKLYNGVRNLDSVTAELIRLEPEKVLLLPGQHEFSENFDPNSENPEYPEISSFVKGLDRSRNDHKLLREKATELGLYLPPGFTSKPTVSLGNDKYPDFYYSQARNWEIGFQNGLRRLSHAVLFRTDRQTLGMSKCKPQTDDEIWILDGAYAPICLRPCANGNYRFLGEVYIHEIMDGEAVEACTDPVCVVIE